MFDRGQREEYATMGIDEYLQGTGSDPSHGISRLGLRIPPLVTPSFASGGQDSRYLFNLLNVDIAEDESVVIRSIRQFLTIGALTSKKHVTELLVGNYGSGNPAFHLLGGSVSWHFRIVGKNELISQQGPYKSRNLQYKSSNDGSPSMLYGDGTTFPADNVDALGNVDFYTSVNNYVPFNGGVPWGDPLCPGLGTIYDIRYPWYAPDTGSLEILVPRSGVLSVFASVRQVIGSALSGSPRFGLSNEENFVINFPGGDGGIATQYWAVGIGMGLERRKKQ